MKILLSVLLIMISSCNSKEPYKDKFGNLVIPAYYPHTAHHYYEIHPLYKAYKKMPLTYQDSLYICSKWTFQDILDYEFLVDSKQYCPHISQSKVTE